MIYLFILAVFLTYLGYPVVEKLLFDYQLVAENYSGKEIPVGYGLLLMVNSIIILATGSLIGVYTFELSFSFIILILAVGIIGIIDDYYGGEENKGFKDHIGKFIRKFQVTTGFLKAVVTSLFSLLIVIRFTDDILLVVVNFLLIVLMTNFINLLDLRPGRALKGFIIIFLLLFFVVDLLFYKLMLPILIMIFILLPVDLKERSMLGDVGANLLGSFLGLSCVFSLSLANKLVLVGLLIIIHLYAEEFSLTKFIARNKILNYLDDLGKV